MQETKTHTILNLCDLNNMPSISPNTIHLEVEKNILYIKEQELKRLKSGLLCIKNDFNQQQPQKEVISNNEHYDHKSNMDMNTEKQIQCIQCGSLLYTKQKMVPNNKNASDAIPSSNLSELKQGHNDTTIGESINGYKRRNISNLHHSILQEQHNVEIDITSICQNVSNCTKRENEMTCNKCVWKRHNEEKKNPLCSLMKTGVMKNSMVKNIKSNNIKGDTFRSFWTSKLCMGRSCKRKAESYGYCRICYKIQKAKQEKSES